MLGVQSALTPATVPAATLGATVDACDLTPVVRTALMADPDAIAAVHAFPSASLSMANAYVLWDAGWTPPSANAPQTALDPIRKVVTDRINAATPECRDQLQLGPRLVIIGDGSSAVTMVIGSGAWHWGDLTMPAPPIDSAPVKNSPASIR